MDRFQQLLDEAFDLLVGTLKGIERFQRYFSPLQVAAAQDALLPYGPSLSAMAERVGEIAVREPLPEVKDVVQTTLQQTFEAIQLITTATEEDFRGVFAQVMRAFRRWCMVQERLYRHRSLSQTVRRYFVEPSVLARIEELDPSHSELQDVGLIHLGGEENPYARGMHSLYIPESYHASRSWPLVVALHGGRGHGRDFIWTWLREAKSRASFFWPPPLWATPGLCVIQSWTAPCFSNQWSK